VSRAEGRFAASRHKNQKARFIAGPFLMRTPRDSTAAPPARLRLRWPASP
jgi:hypothetical protein